MYKAPIMNIQIIPPVVKSNEYPFQENSPQTTFVQGIMAPVPKIDVLKIISFNPSPSGINANKKTNLTTLFWSVVTHEDACLYFVQEYLPEADPDWRGKYYSIIHSKIKDACILYSKHKLLHCKEILSLPATVNDFNRFLVDKIYMDEASWKIQEKKLTERSIYAKFQFRQNAGRYFIGVSHHANNNQSTGGSMLADDKLLQAKNFLLYLRAVAILNKLFVVVGADFNCGINQLIGSLPNVYISPYMRTPRRQLLSIDCFAIISPYSLYSENAITTEGGIGDNLSYNISLGPCSAINLSKYNIEADAVAAANHDPLRCSIIISDEE